MEWESVGWMELREGIREAAGEHAFTSIFVQAVNTVLGCLLAFDVPYTPTH